MMQMFGIILTSWSIMMLPTFMISEVVEDSLSILLQNQCRISFDASMIVMSCDPALFSTRDVDAMITGASYV
jgi:hypothetical protein